MLKWASRLAEQASVQQQHMAHETLGLEYMLFLGNVMVKHSRQVLCCRQ